MISSIDIDKPLQKIFRIDKVSPDKRGLLRLDPIFVDDSYRFMSRPDDEVLIKKEPDSSEVREFSSS